MVRHPREKEWRPLHKLPTVQTPRVDGRAPTQSTPSRRYLQTGSEYIRWLAQKGKKNTFLLGTRVFKSPKIGFQWQVLNIISTSNIIKLTLEELSSDDQHHFEDIMKQEKEEALWQYVERHEKMKEKYLSNFTVDRHQKSSSNGRSRWHLS